MATNSSLQYLDVSARNKDKLEVFFDLETILKTLEYQRDATSSEYADRTMTDELNEQLTEALTSVLPPVDEIVAILRDDFNLVITDDNELVLNWVDLIVTEVPNLGAVDIPLPVNNLFSVETLQNLLPFGNLT